MEVTEDAQVPGAPVARIATIMVNAVDAARLAQFWADLLGTAVSSRFEQFVWLEPAGPAALRARAESLGAGFVEGNDIGDFHWDVMQDPEGNEFCIAGD